MLTYVLAKDGTPLMPTYKINKVRRMLKEGNAEITGHKPGFTIRLLYESGKGTQPVEVCEDTGYGTIGVSVKSEKHEFAHEEYMLLPDEKVRYDDCRKYRRARRNRIRHRAAKFDNRKKDKGWTAPSLDNKAQRHADIVTVYKKVLPVTDVTLEAGTFDTQVLEAVETGRPLPKGIGYQYGPQYGFDTLREAVFYRDGYKCICCGKSAVEDHAILKIHHLGFLKGDHSDRMGNLATVCSKCHTPSNHKPGGKLYNLKPRLKPLGGAAFMNTIRWKIYNMVKERNPGLCVHMTYGAVTKRERLRRHIGKTHANDAYCIGLFRPKHKTRAVAYKKVRRNDRIIQKFYDAVYIDRRDGKKKKGAELSCNRTNRSVPRNNSRNERPFRKGKVSKGHVTTRKGRTQLKPGSLVLYKGQVMTVHGTHANKGKVNVEFTQKASDGRKSAYLSKVTIIRPMYRSGWVRLG